MFVAALKIELNNHKPIFLLNIYTSISQSLAALSRMFFPILSWGGISECHFYGGWKVNEMKVGQFYFYNKDKAAYLVSAL